ncbi:hypothetical protein [Brevundimonas bullata]
MSPLKPNQVPKEWRAIISPWTPDLELARVLMLRAAILWSYSHIERRLMEFAIRCSSTPEYRDVSEKAPFRRAARIAYLRKVLELDGPLKPVAGLGSAILDRYEESAEIRNRMAHADIDLVAPDMVRFIEIAMEGQDITERRFNYYPGDLERQAIKAARFSKAVQRLHYKTFKDEGVANDWEGDI